MYPPSSSQGLMGAGSAAPAVSGSLTRYGSAPSSLLTTAVESTSRELSAVGFQTHLAPTRFFPTENPDAMATHNDAVDDHGKAKSATRVQPWCGGGGGGGGGGAAGPSCSSPLVRHNSSPPGLINQLPSASRCDNPGFSIIRSTGRVDHSHVETRMNSELNFSTQQENFSHISKETENSHRKAKHSYVEASTGMRGWDDTQPIMFSVAQSKNNVVVDSLSNVESQFQFSLGMPSMDKLHMNIPQDSIPCKIRAKRGCATHPRSIAERERRTRISGKLKKLHDLVPNMDKQTSYADMLELAVQHIQTLQTKVQKLKGELESCKCGCKNVADS